MAVEWERTDPADDARRFATVALAGPVAELTFRGETHTVQAVTEEAFEGIDIALFSAGGV